MIATRERLVLNRLRHVFQRPQHAARVGAAIAAALVSLAGGGLALAHLGGPNVSELGQGEILSIATRGNGDIVAVGFRGQNMLVVAMDRNGGHRRQFNAGRGVANAVAVQRDGKVLVAGSTSPFGTAALVNDMVLKRFNSSGSPDRSFGAGGTVNTRAAVANSVALGPGNMILAGGSIPGADSTPRVALVRLHSNGAVDRSFGINGLAEIDLGSYSEANAVAGQRDGRVVFAGDQSPGLQVVNAVIARVTSSGRLDGSFGRGGVYLYLHPHGGGASSFRAIAIGGGGTIFGGGGDVQNSGQHALFVSLSSRGGTRWVLTSPSERHASTGENIGAAAMTLTKTGTIFAAGKYLDSGLSYGAVWTIKPNGSLDPRQGLVKAKLPGRLGGEARAIALGAAGSVITGGDLIELTTRRAFLARYPFRR